MRILMIINYNLRSNILLIGIIIITIVISSSSFFLKTEYGINDYDRISITCLAEKGIDGDQNRNLYVVCKKILTKLLEELDENKIYEKEYINYLIEKRPSIYLKHKNGFMKSGKAYYNFYYKELKNKNELLYYLKNIISSNKFNLHESLNRIFVSGFLIDTDKINSTELKLEYSYSMLIKHNF